MEWRSGRRRGNIEDRRGWPHRLSVEQRARKRADRHYIDSKVGSEVLSPPSRATKARRKARESLNWNKYGR